MLVATICVSCCFTQKSTWRLFSYMRCRQSTPKSLLETGFAKQSLCGKETQSTTFTHSYSPEICPIDKSVKSELHFCRRGERKETRVGNAVMTFVDCCTHMIYIYKSTGLLVPIQVSQWLINALCPGTFVMSPTGYFFKHVFYPTFQQDFPHGIHTRPELGV